MVKPTSKETWPVDEIGIATGITPQLRLNNAGSKRFQSNKRRPGNLLRLITNPLYRNPFAIFYCSLILPNDLLLEVLFSGKVGI